MGAILSFGIPVYNGDRYLESALGSIQQQSLENIEIVISDNGSDDGTQEICETATRSDTRIKYLRVASNKGGSWNYNNVWNHSTAKYFSWMAADDIKLPDFAASTVNALEDAGPEWVLACPRTRLIDGSGQIFEDLNDTDLGVDAPEPWRRIQRLLRSQASHLMYGTIRASELRRTRAVLPVVGDDMVLLVELLCLGRMYTTPNQSFLQRRHPAQFSAQGDGQVKWHDPDASVTFSFPQMVLDLELHRAVIRSPLPGAEKRRALAQILPHWALPRWRGVAHDFRVAGRAIGQRVARSVTRSG